MILASPASFELSSVSRPTRLPLILSVLLHALVAAAWIGFPVAEDKAPEEKAVEVELMREAPPPPAPAQGKVAAESQGAGSDAAPIPQLEDGALARQSSPPVPKPSPVPPRPRMEAAPKKPAPVTQSERDFVLSQVIRHWSPPAGLEAREKGDVRLAVMVGGDGYFAEFYDARRAWNPVEAFDGYNALDPKSLERRTVDALYRAIRQAQPVRLPPELKAKAPFPVRLDFRLKDVR